MSEEETEHGTQESGNELIMNTTSSSERSCTVGMCRSHQGPGSRFCPHFQVTLISFARLCAYNPLANLTLDQPAATEAL